MACWSVLSADHLLVKWFGVIIGLVVDFVLYVLSVDAVAIYMIRIRSIIGLGSIMKIISKKMVDV